MSAPRSGGTGFDPGRRHTKVVNNGTSCSPLGTRIFGVGLGLGAPVSVECDWRWYQVKCLGSDTTIKSTIKVSIELPVTTRHRRDMTDNVESDIKPEQTNINSALNRFKSHFNRAWLINF